VSSSTGPLVDSIPAAPSNFHGSGDVTVAVTVTTSPGRVDSTSELMIQQDTAQVLCNFIFVMYLHSGSGIVSLGLRVASF
jgi:hypothetical protein